MNTLLSSLKTAQPIEAPLTEIIELAIRRLERGRRLDVEAFAAAYPHYAEQLRELLPVVAAMFGLGRHTADLGDGKRVDIDRQSNYTPTSCALEVRCPNCHQPTQIAVDTKLTNLTCDSCGSQFSLVDATDAICAARSLTTLGRFELIERLGVGGFGSVWKARDKELDRTVAIKVPRADRMTAEEQEKFFREARAAAQLRHPNIVSVHEVGRDGTSVYIVSDFVRGVTLGDWLVGQQPTNREAAELCAKIAEALHHAHEHGVIHRDLKPANIIIDGEGEPHLMDFGLARRELGEITVTIDGQMLGTPAYMSPEQAQGEAHSADRRSDVYSLGVILFQLLTGELPFRGNARMLLHQVVNDEPPSPREFNSSIKRDLETITLKCLEKSPARRYQTAKEVADDLRRFLAGEPTMARPVSPLQRGAKWAGRHRALSALIAVVAASLVLFLASSAWHANRLQRELAISNDLRMTAHQREANYHELLYAADMRLAYHAFTEKDVVRAAELLDAHVPHAGEHDYRDLEWYYLHHRAVGEHIVIDEVGTPICDLAFSPHKDRLATIGEDARLRVYEWPSGKRLMNIATGQKAGSAVEFSRDAETIATAGEDGTLKIWNAKDLSAIRTIKAHDGEINGIVRCSPPNAWCTCADEPMIRIWDLATGLAIGDLSGHSTEVRSMATGQGRGNNLLASVADNCRIWDLNSKKQIWDWKGSPRPYSVAFSDDNSVIAVGLVDGSIKRWQVDNWTPLPDLASVQNAPQITYSWKNSFFAAGNRMGAIWIWQHEDNDATSLPVLVTTWHAHAGRVTDLAFAPKGQDLVSVGDDGKLIRWPKKSWRAEQVLDFPGILRCVAGFQGAPLAALASTSGVVIADVRNRSIVARLNSDKLDWQSIAVSDNAKVVAAASQNGEVWVWPEWETTPERHNVYRPCANVDAVRLSPDGRLLFAKSGGREAGPIVVDLASGKTRNGLASRGCSAMAVSPDGTLLAAGEHDSNDILVWNIESGELMYRFDPFHSTVSALAFSPDSRRLAALNDNAMLTLWDIATGRQLWTSTSFEGAKTKGASCIAFAPSGRSVMTTNSLGGVSIWNVATGRELFVLSHAADLRSITLCDKGRYLCSAMGQRLCVLQTGMPGGTASKVP